MTSDTKKRKPKKDPARTRKDKPLHLPKALPPYPQVPPIQASRRPGFDFYEYVNSKWLRTVKTPPWRAAFGVSEELEEKIKKELAIYIEPTSSNKLAKQVEIVAESALRPSLQKNNVSLLSSILQDVHCLRDTKDICIMLAQLTKYRITSLLSFYTYYEAGKKVYCRPALAIGQLGLPDTTYYFGAAPGKSKTLLAYGVMLDKIGKLLDLSFPLSPVINIEQYFAQEIIATQTEDETHIKGSELQSSYPEFAWTEFWETLGFDSWKESRFRLNPAGWIRAIEKALKKLSIQEWKLLLTVHIILHALPMLPPPFDSIHFDFFEHRLRGQSKKVPQKELTIRLLQDWMPGIMSRLYLKDHIASGLKSTVTEFTNLIRTAAIKRITSTEWFEPTTRKKAVLKIQKMRTGVAYPNTFPPLPEVQLTPQNLLKNILMLGEDHTKNEIHMVNTLCSIENTWDDAIFAVNAYYYNDTNQMILPAGGLQWPFYHKKAPQGWNFGGLGAIIGHEMTHAFDSDGKDFDENGKKENWWTPADNREYNKRTRAIISLYNQAKVLGHPVSGKLTLNENISDLGGLAIALDALLMELDQKKASPEERKKAYQNFFISYAVSWRIKEKPEKVLQGLFLDKHAPAPLRVNLVVSQFDEWYAAFDITPGDELYIPPNKRIRIF